MTDVKGGVSDYAWSPDGKRLVLVVERARIRAIRQGRRTTTDDREEDAAKPIVIDRYHFKADVSGYLRGERIAPVPVRRRDEEGRAADRRRLRRGVAGVVARRHADRVRPPARRRATSTRRRTPTSSSIDARAGAQPRQLTTHRRRTKRAGWRGARTASRSPIWSATS